jgi:hypothetical protein
VNLLILIPIIVVILSAIGVGIYFLTKKKTNPIPPVSNIATSLQITIGKIERNV